MQFIVEKNSTCDGHESDKEEISVSVHLSKVLRLQFISNSIILITKFILNVFCYICNLKIFYAFRLKYNPNTYKFMKGNFFVKSL